MSASMLLQMLESLSEKINQLKQSPVREPIMQLSITIPAIPLISWLAAQQSYPRIYWQGRDKIEEVAAIGSCKSFFFEESLDDTELANYYQQQRSLSNNIDVRY